jgi:uncharacterized protein YjbI with pentapeptide repeats
MNSFGQPHEQPHEYDAVLGGQALPPLNTPVLGGLDRAKLLRRKFLEAYKSGQRNFANQDLSGIDLSGSSLYQVNLSASNLNQSNLVAANLRKASLIRTNFCGADLGSTNFTDAILFSTNLRDANLRNACLFGSDLRVADFQNADLQDADLFGADLNNALNLTANQIKSARNWQQAKYDASWRRLLNLPPSLTFN